MGHAKLLKTNDRASIVQCNKNAKLNNWGQVIIKYAHSYTIY